MAESIGRPFWHVQLVALHHFEWKILAQSHRRTLYLRWKFWARNVCRVFGRIVVLSCRVPDDSHCYRSVKSAGWILEVAFSERTVHLKIRRGNTRSAGTSNQVGVRRLHNKLSSYFAWSLTYLPEKIVHLQMWYRDFIVFDKRRGEGGEVMKKATC